MATIEKRKLSDGETALICPKDEIAMERYLIGGEGGIEIDRCPRCGGIFLDKGELTRLMAMRFDTKKLFKRLDEEVAIAGKASRTPVVLKCPRDGTPMVTVRMHDQKHIEYEVCPECGGVYFDAGELEDLSTVTLIEKLANFFRS
ncbi:MAG: zf-TFIIB domain-containing protein [Planctomycetota bacterium]